MHFVALLLSFVLSAVDTVPPDDDGPLSPMLLWAVFMLIIVVITVAAAILVAVTVFVLLTLGIVSSSALVAVFRQRFSSGLRALHYQICAVLGIGGGIGALWLAIFFSGSYLAPRALLFAGSIIGLCGGLLLALLLDRLAVMVHRRLLNSTAGR